MNNSILRYLDDKSISLIPIIQSTRPANIAGRFFYFTRVEGAVPGARYVGYSKGVVYQQSPPPGAGDGRPPRDPLRPPRGCIFVYARRIQGPMDSAGFRVYPDAAKPASHAVAGWYIFYRYKYTQ